MAWLRLAGAASAAGLAVLCASTPAWTTTSLAEAPSPAAEVGGGDKLRLVQVVFRHGARTPLSKLYWPELVEAWDVCSSAYEPVAVALTTEDGGPRPQNAHDRDQVATKLVGGCARGELTRDGQIQARALGAWLRQRYVEDLHFLPSAPQPGALVGRTTNYSRTVATLRGVLTGLYPGATTPFKAVTTEEMDEILYGNAGTCARLGALIKELASAERERDAAPPPEVEALEVRVRGALGLPAGERVRFLDLHDTLTTMRQHGKPIPAALQDPQVLRQVEEQATRAFLQFVAPPGDAKEEVLRLGMGRLMYQLVQRMEAAAVAGPSAPRAFLYSGHDSTIMPLLAALGKEVDHWPPYLSNFVFELWERPQGEAYVRVLYNKAELPLTEVCGGRTCTLRQLRETVLAPMLVASREEKEAGCLLHFSHDKPAGEEVRSGSAVVGDD